ncbi:MAG: IreB family regulatory phosphoprotein [Clostridia bacterium]|nr:IreB family regulatory phosphoprotein [Clostridia bacterium]
MSETRPLQIPKEEGRNIREIILSVYQALEEKGYNSVNQFVGYIISGDPTYITSHNGARALIGRLERDDILEELLRVYLEKENHQ